ncbi:MAG: hypothetical protein IJO97_02495 [Lachnospiraceae bacterium]|nr:hypothetical protein [Lachnospiraceae bacterium]
MDTIILVILLILFLVGTHVVPIGLTMVNFYNMFVPIQNILVQKVKDILIFTLGPLLMGVIYWGLWSPQYWEEALYLPMSGDSFAMHEPLSRVYNPTTATLCILAWLGYMILRFVSKKLPPLMKVLCMAATYIGCGFSIAFIIQIFPHSFEAFAFMPWEAPMLCLFPANYIISTITVIKEVLLEEKELIEVQTGVPEKKVLSKIGTLLQNSKNWTILALVATIPLLGICVMVLLLFGQQPDAMVKIFTDTSDWTFSKMTSPPTVYYDDHYLCTVAAGGHQKLVKPLRFGKRHGRTIIVNRQLCIANAFEELIAEKTPHFHKKLRHFYDTYGYPVAKHITNKWIADITYLIMKPLEWLFLIILYFFDMQPEKRISRQYL